MKYRPLSKKEHDETTIDIIETLLKPIVYSGSHRQSDWENGWNENLKSGDYRPKYFGKYKVNRINGKFVIGIGKHFEEKMLYSLVDELAYRYLTDKKDVYEFGCGTGHHLKRLQKILPNANLHGFDWAASSNTLVRRLGFDAKQFNFFEPNYSIGLAEDSAVYTVAALEQVGTRFEQFLKYLIRNKPSIVINIEPIPELLDPTNLLDYLSIKYMEKRKYLTGYLDTLRILEKQGKIKILEARRSGIGSKFIDGYSVVVWKPL